ncbi:MAG: (d)CMP kinase, partial [Pseudomonadota bacterium]
MPKPPFTVAIDGPAAAGKGTIARAMAEHFGFGHLDTGLLYRAVGKATLDRGRGTIDPVVAEELAKRLDVTGMDESVLRTAMVARAASRVAALPGVRAALVE